MTRKKFSFFPDDWLAGTVTMTAAERGVYIDLLATCWSAGALTEEEAIRAGRGDAETVRAVLARKFKRGEDGKWLNQRLERERGRGRGGPQTAADAKTVAGGVICLLNGNGGQVAINKPLLIFPCRGGVKEWVLTEGQVAAWCDSFPGVDVAGECRKALAWVQANGTKTAGGMARFLVSWLNRATNGRAGRIQNGNETKTFRQIDLLERERMLERLKREENDRGEFDGCYLEGGGK